MRLRPDAGSKPLVVGLSAVILMLLVVIAYLAWPSGGESDRPGTDRGDAFAGNQKPALAPGEVSTRDGPDAPVVRAATAAPVGDSATVAQSLVEGSTHHVLQKAGLAGRGKDQDWESGELIRIGVTAEIAYDRKIEANDGKRIVEVRDYHYHRVVKILSGAADFYVDPGSPADPKLSGLEGLSLGRFAPVEAPEELIRSLVRPDAGPLVVGGMAKVYAGQGTLTGKTVRVTTVDGKGVVSVEPVGCTLTAWERDHIFNKDPLVATRFVVELGRLNVGSEVTLPGYLFSDMLEIVFAEPAPRITGQVVIRRADDVVEGGQRLAVVTVKEDGSELRSAAADDEGRVYATFLPGGRIRFAPGRGLVRDIAMDGTLRIEAVPEGGPLGEAVLVDDPRLMLTYHSGTGNAR